MTTNNHPDLGIEFDWLASDQNGNLALMSTAGFGTCPDASSQFRENTIETIDLILSELNLKDADLLISRPETGLIVYDWSSLKKRYERKYIPEAYVNSALLKRKKVSLTVVFALDIDFLENNEIFGENIYEGD